MVYGGKHMNKLELSHKFYREIGDVSALCQRGGCALKSRVSRINGANQGGENGFFRNRLSKKGKEEIAVVPRDHSFRWDGGVAGRRKNRAWTKPGDGRTGV